MQTYQIRHPVIDVYYRVVTVKTSKQNREVGGEENVLTKMPAEDIETDTVGQLAHSVVLSRLGISMHLQNQALQLPFF
jgi:hypothetical protein